MIRTTGVVVRFGARALEFPDLAPGDAPAIGIVGGNGTGKSTYLRAIAGLLRAAAGRIDAPPPGRTTLLAQHPWLLRGTARHNVEWALRTAGAPRRDRRRRADEALDRTGARDLADRDVAGLSGGERRRVAVARAIVHGPQVLLLDEPFEGLDDAGLASVTSAILGSGAFRVVASPRPLPSLAPRWVELAPGPALRPTSAPS